MKIMQFTTKLQYEIYTNLNKFVDDNFEILEIMYYEWYLPALLTQRSFQYFTEKVWIEMQKHGFI